MNLENIRKLIKDKKLEPLIMEIIEFEQSKLHQSKPHYKDAYYKVIEECKNDFSKN